MEHCRLFLRLAALIIVALACCASVDRASAQTVLCAPESLGAAAGNVASPQTGTIYTLNGQGCATFSAADAAYFQTQGFRPPPGGGGGTFPPTGCATANGVVFNNATPCDTGLTYAGSGGAVAYAGSLVGPATGSAAASIVNFGTPGTGIFGTTNTVQVSISGTLKAFFGAASALTMNGTTPFTTPSISSDATHTSVTLCEDSTTHAAYFGSGTAGICLGTSSARFKNSILPMQAGLEELLHLDTISFRYNEGYGDGGARRLYGFTAEQVAEVMPELVGLDVDGKPQSVDWAGLVPVLVRAIQQQQAEIEALKRRLD